MSVLAWHFVADTLRDGSPVPDDGVKLVHNGPLEMCTAGLHASERIIDALDYAPGNTICRVEIGGEIIRDTDKLVAGERTIVWRLDGEDILNEFARKCALDVIHLWDAPQIVRQYLETGNDEIRVAARDAWAAGYAARAAWAAGDAARDAWAAGDAARDAAWAATGDAWAAGYAARAAGYAARAAWAAGDAWAAGYAARAAARDSQNSRLTEMVETARDET